MKFQLMSITGIESAIASMKFTKRTWNPEWDATMRKNVQTVFDRNGFYIKGCEDKEAVEYVNKQLEILRKVGAGWGDASFDAGHETILRFIDLEVVVSGLHRAAQDDLDAHAMRMNNRIVRSSSRSGNDTNTDEPSDWYKLRTMTFDDFMKLIQDNRQEDEETLYDSFPNEFGLNIDGQEYKMVKTPHGYIREDLVENGDAQRGLYHLGMSSNCIFKVNLYDMRHIYMRRNPYTKANPELAAGIESLALQIEDALPILGDVVRHEYCDDGEVHHVMYVSKHFTAMPRISSLDDEDAASFK